MGEERGEIGGVTSFSGVCGIGVAGAEIDTLLLGDLDFLRLDVVGVVDVVVVVVGVVVFDVVGVVVVVVASIIGVVVASAPGVRVPEVVGVTGVVAFVGVVVGVFVVDFLLRFCCNIFSILKKNNMRTPNRQYIAQQGAPDVSFAYLIVHRAHCDLTSALRAQLFSTKLQHTGRA